MYAPFGSGALIGSRDGFARAPDHPGGGTVDAVTLDGVALDRPARPGGGGHARTCSARSPSPPRSATLTSSVWDRIVAHEARRCCGHALDRSAPRCPACAVHGPATTPARPSAWCRSRWTGSTTDWSPPSSATSTASRVRSGCFCAHPYVAHLLAAEPRRRCGLGRGGPTRTTSAAHPGWSESASAATTTWHDVDRVVQGLERVVDGDIVADYLADVDGSFHPVGYVEPMLFSLDAR